MNKCPKCGFEVGENHKFCTSCGFDLENGGIIDTQGSNESVNTTENITSSNQIPTTTENSNINNQTVTQSNNDVIDETYRKNAKTLMIIHYCLFGSPFIMLLLKNIGIDLESLSGICSLGALGTIIAARVKYGKLKYVRVTFIIEIILYVLGILAIVLLLVACMNALKNCNLG